MIAKRLGAVVVAAGLIIAAVLIRSNVIEGDDGPDEPRQETAAVLVCLTELKPLCDQITGITVRIASAADTTQAWSTADPLVSELWLTLAPLPDIVESYRAADRRQPLGIAPTPIAATSLVAVLPNEAKAEALRATCGNTLAWRCIGERTGQAWSEIGGPSSGGTVRPAFAPLSTAVGQLGVTQAVLGYFGDAPVNPSDTDLIGWVRRVARAVPATALSLGTPVGTIQTARAALDVAIGLDAEIVNAQRDRLKVLYAAPMTRVDLVLAAPQGVRVDAGIVAQLKDAAVASAWMSASSTGSLGTTLAAAEVIRATGLWEDLT